MAVCRISLETSNNIELLASIRVVSFHPETDNAFCFWFSRGIRNSWLLCFYPPCRLRRCSGRHSPHSCIDFCFVPIPLFGAWNFRYLKNESLSKNEMNMDGDCSLLARLFPKDVDDFSQQNLKQIFSHPPVFSVYVCVWTYFLIFYLCKCLHSVPLGKSRRQHHGK